MFSLGSLLRAYALLMLMTILGALVFMFVFWFVLAQFSTPKKDRAKEKSQNLEFALAGAAFVVIMAVVLPLLM